MKISFCFTSGLELFYSVFATISRFRERIIIEHIELKNSSGFELHNDPVCAIRTPSRNCDIVQLNFDQSVIHSDFNLENNDPNIKSGLFVRNSH